MQKKFMVSAMLSLAFAGVVFFSIETSSGSSQGASDQTKPLNQAIKDLQHPDKIVRRQAARQLSTLIETPGIKRAIRPLSDLLLDRGTRSGVFTQELAATDLGLIALKLGSPQGDPALDALIECLMTEGYDTVRAAAATALGLTKNELALEPLEFARVNDNSILVRYAAQEALNRLGRGGLSLPQTLTALPATDVNASIIDETDLIEYWKAHLIYSNPRLDEKGGRP